MSIALEIGRSEFGRVPIYVAPEERPVMSSSSSSSIGKNSESWRSDGEDSSGEKEDDEVESAFKGSACDLNSLEEALPIRRGISSCYQGKSKSFSSLSDAVTSCNSASDFAKPENACNRKRRNEIAKKIYLNKSPFNQLHSNRGGISKRFPTSRSTLALAVAMNNAKDINEQEPQQNRLLPPLHSRSKASDGSESPDSLSPLEYYSFPTRSLSLTDLELLAAASGSSGRSKNIRTRF